MMSILFNAIKNYKFFIMWSILIVFLCMLPLRSTQSTSWFSFDHMDKVAHFFLYFIGSALFYWAHKTRKKIFFILLYPIILGAGIEIIQHYYIPGRSGELADGLMNILGSLVFIVLIRTYKHLLTKRV